MTGGHWAYATVKNFSFQMLTSNFTHGTVSFGALVWLGLNSVTANATNTVAVWPGVVSGMVGYRRELRTLEKRFLHLAIPSLIGGLLGAYLLRLTPSTIFDRLVPYLILFATILFIVQEPVQRKLKSSNPEAHKSAAWFAGAIIFQFMVGVYGGYFGAGIGILMLAAFSVLGMTDIHQMNGFKNMLGGSINLLAGRCRCLSNARNQWLCEGLRYSAYS